MPTSLARMFSDSAEGSRGKTVGLYAVLIAANGLAWTWALVTFAGRPTLLGTALLAYAIADGFRLDFPRPKHLRTPHSVCLPID